MCVYFFLRQSRGAGLKIVVRFLSYKCLGNFGGEKCGKRKGRMGLESVFGYLAIIL